MVFSMTTFFLVLLALCVPVSIAIGLSSSIALWLWSDISLSIIPQRLIAQVNYFPMLAVPFFILAGFIMEMGGLSKRLVDFGSALVGHIWGGIGQASTVASLIFAGISGSASADTAATGAIVIPVLKREGYPAGFAAALEATGGTLGTIMPPSILMIIYGAITGLSMRMLFLAGVIPAVVTTLGIMIVNYTYAKEFGIQPTEKFRASKVIRTFVDGIWAILAPLIILGGIFSGIFTATEAGAIAALYAIIVSVFIYKELSLKDLFVALESTAITTSIVMFVVAASGAFAWVLTFEQAPAEVIAYLSLITENHVAIMFILSALLIMLGCFIEPAPLAIITIPVIQPVVTRLGIDPIHAAMVFLLAMIIGFITPPVGGQIFLASKIAKCEATETYRYMWRYLLPIVVLLILLILFPSLSTFIPNTVAKL